MKRNSSPSAEDDNSQNGKKRRQLTEEETEVLKREFEAHRDGKVPPPRKRELANELGLSEAQVFNWFNNHRQRHKTPSTPTTNSSSYIKTIDEENESESNSEPHNHLNGHSSNNNNNNNNSLLSVSERPSPTILKDPFVMNLMAENERLRNELTELRERLNEMNGVNGEEESNGHSNNHRRRSKNSHSTKQNELDEEDHEAISAAVSCVASLFDKVPSLRKFAPQPYYSLSSGNSNRLNKSRA